MRRAPAAPFVLALAVLALAGLALVPPGIATSPAGFAAATSGAGHVAVNPGPSPVPLPAFRDASTPWAFRFPRDHAAHAHFRTEWWYYTGHLDAADRRYGFELTFFRVGLQPPATARASAWALRDLVFAHAALTDERGRRFLFADTLARPSLGRAGADTTRYHVWLDTWGAGLEPDDRTHRLRADAGRFAFELSLDPAMPPIVHGRDGISRKAEDPAMSSHYYSIPRLDARGRLRLDGAWHDVRGTAWMDHEFMTTPESGIARGWDWFSVQLDDGTALMLYRLRRDGGGVEPNSSGTWIDANGAGRHLALADFRVESTGTWTSPVSRARYPSGWRLHVPSASLDLTLDPVLADQELRTRGVAAVTYWEGSVRVRGTRGSRAVGGVGYVELTGYAGPPPGR